MKKLIAALLFAGLASAQLPPPVCPTPRDCPGNSEESSLFAVIAKIFKPSPRPPAPAPPKPVPPTK